MSVVGEQGDQGVRLAALQALRRGVERGGAGHADHRAHAHHRAGHGVEVEVPVPVPGDVGLAEQVAAQVEVGHLHNDVERSVQHRAGFGTEDLDRRRDGKRRVADLRRRAGGLVVDVDRLSVGLHLGVVVLGGDHTDGLLSGFNVLQREGGLRRAEHVDERLVEEHVVVPLALLVLLAGDVAGVVEAAGRHLQRQRVGRHHRPAARRRDGHLHRVSARLHRHHRATRHLR